MTVGDLLDEIRSAYLGRLSQSWAESRSRPGVEIASEAVLCDASGQAVREGAWALPCRVDTCVIENGEVVEQIMVSSDRIPSFAPVEFEWSGALRVRLEPFPWDYCELRLASPIAGFGHFQSWFDRWFDTGDSRPKDDRGFQNVVHFLSDPEARGTGTTLLVDLGTAPVEAFEQLLDAALASGQTRVEVGQHGE